MKPVGVLVEDVPETVRLAVDEDSRERDMSRNDVVCQILADRFRVPVELTGYPYSGADGSEWSLRMPVELRDAIQAYVREHSTPGRKLTQRGVVIATLELHYDLPVSSPRRRRSHPPIDPDIVRDARARADAGESIRSLSRRYGIKRETIARAIRA